MKKVLVILLMLAMLFVFVGCGDEDGVEDVAIESEENFEVTEDVVNTPPVEEKPAYDIKVVIKEIDELFENGIADGKSEIDVYDEIINKYPMVDRIELDMIIETNMNEIVITKGMSERNEYRTQELSSIKALLKSYFDTNKKYPASFEDLKSLEAYNEELFDENNEIGENEVNRCSFTYRYETTEDFMDYNLFGCKEHEDGGVETVVIKPVNK